MKKESHVYVMWKNIYLIIFNYHKFDSTRTVTKMSLRPIKFMFLILCFLKCYVLKMYCFQMLTLFCQRKLQFLRNRMRLELTSSSFQVKRSILLKKKNIFDRRICWVKKDKLVPGGTSF